MSGGPGQGLCASARGSAQTRGAPSKRAGFRTSTRASVQARRAPRKHAGNRSGLQSLLAKGLGVWQEKAKPRAEAPHRCASAQARGPPCKRAGLRGLQSLLAKGLEVWQEGKAQRRSFAQVRRAWRLRAQVRKTSGYLDARPVPIGGEGLGVRLQASFILFFGLSSPGLPASCSPFGSARFGQGIRNLWERRVGPTKRRQRFGLQAAGSVRPQSKCCQGLKALVNPNLQPLNPKTSNPKTAARNTLNPMPFNTEPPNPKPGTLGLKALGQSSEPAVASSPGAQGSHDVSEIRVWGVWGFSRGV